jgi:hypothetical protein
MGKGSHNSSCARAGGHVCKCTGCGGSLHGWQGWVALAAAADSERQHRRGQVDGRWEKGHRRWRRRPNRDVREASTDLARLDIADWLAADSASTTASATAEVAGRSSRSAGVTAARLHDGPDSEGAWPDPAMSGDSTYPSALDQVVTLAEAMTRSTWQEISAELDADLPAAREIKRQLAHHGWCDLFVGLIQVVDASREALDRIPDGAKSVVKAAILHSSMQGMRKQVTGAVIDVVVDKVWIAFKTAISTKIPLLGIITSEDAARSLRILAVFT